MIDIAVMVFGLLAMVFALLAGLLYLVAALLLIVLISASYTTAIIYLVQKIFFRSFFPKLEQKQVFWAVVDVTVTNLLLCVVMLFLGLTALPAQAFMLPLVLLESAVIFAVDFLLMRYWELGGKKQVAGTALALGIFSNPFVIFYLAAMQPLLLFAVGLAVLAGAVVFAPLGIKVLGEKPKKKAVKPGAQEKWPRKGTTIALTAIAVILAIAFFFVLITISMGDRSSYLYCSSNQPGQINVVTSNLNAGPFASGQQLGELIITNMVGGRITDLQCTGSGAFSSDVLGCKDFEPGNHTITILAGQPGSYTSGRINIDYLDPAGLRQTAAITCQGVTINIE